MMQPSSLLLVDADTRSLETLTFGFEREGFRKAHYRRGDGEYVDAILMAYAVE